MRIASAGHAVFAATMVAVGILGLIKGDLTAVWQPIPKGVSASEAPAYFCAFISVGCGMGLLWQRKAALAARGLLAYLLLWLLVFRVPGLLRGLTVDAYWSLCKTGVMLAAAWVQYASLAADWDRQRLSFATGESGLSIARALYGLAIIPFGLAHFQYVEHTASSVPSWLPAHVALAHFTGAAFIAAGMARSHRRVRTARSGALGVADGDVLSPGVGTCGGHPLTKQLRVGRGSRHMGADGRRLGRGGFILRHPLARSGQAPSGRVAADSVTLYYGAGVITRIEDLACSVAR